MEDIVLLFLYISLMKETLFKIQGSNYYNNTFHEYNMISELDSDKEISENHFGSQRRYLFKHMNSNSSEEFFEKNQPKVLIV